MYTAELNIALVFAHGVRLDNRECKAVCKIERADKIEIESLVRKVLNPEITGENALFLSARTRVKIDGKFFGDITVVNEQFEDEVSDLYKISK